MTSKTLVFECSSYRQSRSPYSVSRLDPSIAAWAQDWPRGWGTSSMGYHVVKSRTTPLKQRITVLSVLGWIGRMIFPVTMLGLSLLLAYAFMAERSVLMDGLVGGNPLPSTWLTQGHFLVGLSFLVIHLTNRAYGPNFAAAQVIITWTLLGIAAFWLMKDVSAVLATGPVPDGSTVATFVIALGIGQLISVMSFDLTRGPRWWTAPLWGSVIGMTAFVAIYYLARTGVEPNWFSRMGTDLLVKVIAAGFLLIPYYLLRKAIRPQPGFGGA